MVCPGSTSGIEHNFSQLKGIAGEQWHTGPLAEQRRCILRLYTATMGEAEVVELVRSAQLV